MKRILTVLILLSLSSCSENIFNEFADKDTPEAIYFQAKMEINNRNYAQAITLLESLDPAFIGQRQRRPIYASAYSGRCGLEFLTLMTNLQNPGATSLFVSLMAAFPGALAANVDDCIDAETILEEIGNENQRNGDENLLMAFTSLAKIGTILSSLADTDDDGSADATFNQCDVNDLPEVMVREFGASIAVTLLSLGAIGTSYVDSALSSISDLCAMDPNLNAFCTATDPTSFSSNEVQALRYAIGSSDVGINSCGGNDFSDCAVANPACP